MAEAAGHGCLRRLTEADREIVMELVDRDRVMGQLVHSFIVRRGLESSQEFWGLFGGGGCGKDRAHGGEARLEGLFTLDTDGRSTVLGGGPAYAGLIVDFMRGRAALGGTPLAFIDAPREMASAIAALMPPMETESLGVWAHDGHPPKSPVPVAAGLTVRCVDAQADAAALQALYEADETFREIGVNIGDAMDAVRCGLRLMLVGELPHDAAPISSGGGGIVTAAFGWLTDSRLARVSGVVTHPACRGRGYATAVVGRLTFELLRSGRRPFLYVSLGNVPAVRVYERLGYRPHAVVDKLRYGRARY